MSQVCLIRDEKRLISSVKFWDMWVVEQRPSIAGCMPRNCYNCALIRGIGCTDGGGVSLVVQFCIFPDGRLRNGFGVWRTKRYRTPDFQWGLVV